MIRLSQFCFLLLCVASIGSDALAAKVPAKLQGVGLLIMNPQFRQDVKYPVFKEPKSGAAGVGHIMFRDAPNPTWAAQVHSWTEKNPDAGWFGEKEKHFRTQKDLDDYQTQGGMVGLYVLSEQGVWLQTQYGWVNRHDAKSQRMEYVTWEDALDREKQFPEFQLPNERDMSTASHLNDLRKEAYYAPIGALPVYNGEGGGHEIITAQAPLKFAINGQSEDGNWLKVVAVLDPCVASGGQTDYREGTRGWIKRLQDGKPSLFRTPQGCE